MNEDTTISISDSVCWKCGKPFSKGEYQRTVHHVLPRNLNPIKNITIPLHEKCHREVTSEDTASLTNFAYKLTQQAKALLTSTEHLFTSVNKSKQQLTKIEQCEHCKEKSKLVTKDGQLVSVITHSKDCIKNREELK